MLGLTFGFTVGVGLCLVICVLGLRWLGLDTRGVIRIKIRNYIKYLLSLDDRCTKCGNAIVAESTEG